MRRVSIYSAGLPWWATFLIVASWVVVSVAGPRVQARHPRAPALALAAFVAVFVALAAIARWTGPGARVEQAPVELIGWGLPAIASLAALAALQRVAAWARVALALLAGAVASLYSLMAALVAACGLYGSCL